jgi:hypothetical protein
MKPPRPYDVPRALVAALILLLLAIFVPILWVTPGLPSTLPPLSHDLRDVLQWHLRAPQSLPLASIDAEFDALSEATAKRDGRSMAWHQRAFATELWVAVGDDLPARARVRERHLAQFLSVRSFSERCALCSVAARHGLAGAQATAYASRSVLIAWFELRWELAASRSVSRGEFIRLQSLVVRLPPPDRRALLAWLLSASCAELLGRTAGPDLGAGDLARCADQRRQFVELARLLEPVYPLPEGRASVEVLYALALTQLAANESDASARQDLLETAREANLRAHETYATELSRSPSRRIQRYFLATRSAAGE